MKKIKPSPWVVLFKFLGDNFLDARQKQRDIERVELLNEQRREDITLKKQRQRKMEDDIQHRKNQIVILDLEIEARRLALGFPAENPDAQKEFQTTNYDAG